MFTDFVLPLIDILECISCLSFSIEDTLLKILQGHPGEAGRLHHRGEGHGANEGITVAFSVCNII